MQARSVDYGGGGGVFEHERYGHLQWCLVPTWQRSKWEDTSVLWLMAIHDQRRRVRADLAREQLQ